MRKGLIILISIFLLVMPLFFIRLTSSIICCPEIETPKCHEVLNPMTTPRCVDYYSCDNGKCYSCRYVGINAGSSIERCRTDPGCCGLNTFSQCELCICGNGKIEGSEQCDDGASNSDALPDLCRTNCKKAKCGDKIIDSNEECDDGNIVNGDGCNKDCKIELKLKTIDLLLNKDYITKTIAERGFKPKPIFNPFDDVVCEVVLEIPDGASVPDSLSGKLTTPGLISGHITIASGELVRTGLQDQTCPDCKHYQWNIIGWDYGWTSSAEDMNTLILNKNVKCVVNVNGKSESIQKPISMCVQLWGDKSAQFRILNSRDKTVSSSEMSNQKLIEKSWKIVKYGYNSIDPFKAYKDKFVHYADLKSGSCKNEGVYASINNFFSKDTNGRLGSAIFGTKSHKIMPDAEPVHIISIHELGHSFCALEDEYVDTKTPRAPDSKDRNCRKEDFWPLEFGGKFKGCTNNYFFRSTQDSIMTSHTNSQNFNVIGCGYCLFVIDNKNKPLEDYWKDCNNNSFLVEKYKTAQSAIPEKAKEGCYIQLNVNEKNVNEGIEFSLISQENVYGNYASLIYEYAEGNDNYHLVAYSDSGILNSQGISSGRFIYYDDFEEGSGGFEELNEAEIEIIVPYYNNIQSIIIEDDKGNEHLLDINIGLIKCERTCKIAGENGEYDNDRCCLDFTAIPKNETSFLCIKGPQDVNQDGRINVLDLIFVRNKMNRNIITGMDILADVNNDNFIDVLDLVSIRNALNT